MNQAADVVLEEFSLCGANPAGDAVQEFRQEQNACHKGEEQETRGKRLPCAVPPRTP